MAAAVCSISELPFPRFVAASLFDHIGRPSYTERGMVAKKIEGVCFPFVTMGSTPGYPAPIYTLLVRTSRGSFRIDVSRKLFDLTRVKDLVPVKYRVGRISGLLKGRRL